MRYRLITQWFEGKEYPEAIHLVRERSRLGRMIMYCVGLELQTARDITERLNADWEKYDQNDTRR